MGEIYMEIYTAHVGSRISSSVAHSLHQLAGILRDFTFEQKVWEEWDTCGCVLPFFRLVFSDRYSG